MRYFVWGIVVVLALIAAVFAIYNHAPTTLNFWPLPYQLTLPLYGVILATLVIGFILGAAIAWLASARWRRLARVRGRENETLMRQVEALKTPERKALPARSEAAGEAGRDATPAPAGPKD